MKTNDISVLDSDSAVPQDAVARQSQTNLRTLIERLPVGIVFSNENGQITDVNAETLKMFGYMREELVGQPVEKLVPERLRSLHQGQRQGFAKQPHVRPSGIGMELVACRKDGTEFTVEVSLGPLSVAKGIAVASTIVDISERKKIERQLRLAQRMEAIGQLAGGIAHDFNNLLAVIIGCADIVSDSLASDNPVADKVALIRNAGNSAADLVRQLLAFSRQQMLQPQVLDLKEILARIRDTLKRLISEDIQLKLTVEESLGSIKADPGQIEQILLNLAVNARDAMPKGGQLTIIACNVELDDVYKARHEPVAPGKYVRLTVEDTGCGMNAKTQSRIFDPFFTTKELGKGTGLGLATVYGIVKQTGGYIWVYSEVNQGTSFKIYLPRIERTSRVAEGKPTESPALRGTETVLFAEDSESLREMAAEYLQSIGYTVLAAASGTEALQRAKEFKDTIHLLLTDVVMPELNGPELAKEIGLLRPGIKVIFTSGFASDILAKHGSLDPAIAFIQKPYRPKALARRIREVLDGPASKS